MDSSLMSILFASSQKRTTTSRESGPLVWSSAGSPSGVALGLKRRSSPSFILGRESSTITDLASSDTLLLMSRRPSKALISGVFFCPPMIAACALPASARNWPTAKSCSSPVLSKYSRWYRMSTTSGLPCPSRQASMSCARRSLLEIMAITPSTICTRRSVSRSPDSWSSAAGGTRLLDGSALARIIACDIAIWPACWQVRMKVSSACLSSASLG
mmetsp:Transcript_27602/g.74298  ORF Transcript_27602/g.74298 Transcript_27602/m.74298 type:complete len:215 (-) Transcript_27602:744-1388(-)